MADNAKPLTLKPCPFCGEPAFLWRTNWDTIIECSKYHIETHRVMVSARDDETAVGRWNHRADMDIEQKEG